MLVDFVIIGARMAGAMVDPINMLGWVVCGCFAKDALIAAIAGAGWSILLLIFVAAIAGGLGDQANLQATAVLLAGILVALVAHFVRRILRSKAK